VEARVRGTAHTRFAVRRTSESDRYADLGELEIEGRALRYSAPAGSVTTFFGTR